MQNLKPCPCGQTPESVSIADNGSKWAYVSGDCCGEWNVEFRTQYHRIDTPECMALAVEAWNLAGRSSLLTPLALDGATVCPNCGYQVSALICTKCGTPIPATQVTQTVSPPLAQCGRKVNNMEEKKEIDISFFTALTLIGSCSIIGFSIILAAKIIAG